LKSSAKNISLNSYDDIFSTEETREDEKREKVMDVPLSELHPFPDHPFQVRDDDSMKETMESIKEYGVLVPAIVRPRADGGYELISGHRRKHACELAGLSTMPVIIRDLDDDAATIIMVDSNIQRENILPSERAKAYEMKLEAIKRQGTRTDLTCTQVRGVDKPHHSRRNHEKSRETGKKRSALGLIPGTLPCV
jgi:ParB family chromosome partitioning protein